MFALQRRSFCSLVNCCTDFLCILFPSGLISRYQSIILKTQQVSLLLKLKS
uniref:Uncharacterized protein n=1 Tax=Arundo donax TaxID=35708 RepID=A0A0A9DL01_ARUDO